MRRRFYKFSKLGPQIAYALGLGSLIGRKVLLLTTTGRKSGLPRVTPLQYEYIDGDYYLGSALGIKSDWYRNILANPLVDVRVGRKKFKGTADTSTAIERIVDFIQYRLERNPRMLGTILKAHGFPSQPTREQLAEYSKGRALVIIRPLPKT
ncbi:MAG: nitroreductase/quinone reductase family protein [Anaerolineales bacterium]